MPQMGSSRVVAAIPIIKLLAQDSYATLIAKAWIKLGLTT